LRSWKKALPSWGNKILMSVAGKERSFWCKSRRTPYQKCQRQGDARPASCPKGVHHHTAHPCIYTFLTTDSQS
jgi:hypothetical protein